jgi:hypothetical protein
MHAFVRLDLSLKRIRGPRFNHLINQCDIFLHIYPFSVKLLLIVIFVLIGFLPLYLPEIDLTQLPRLLLLPIFITQVDQLIGVFQLALPRGGDLLVASSVM